MKADRIVPERNRSTVDTSSVSAAGGGANRNPELYDPDEAQHAEHPKKATAVFKISLVIGLLIVATCAIFPGQFQSTTQVIRGFIATNFGWYYLLLVSDGLNALQNALIITAFPFSIIMIMIAVALVKELHHERKMMGLYLKPDQLPSETVPFRSYEQQDFHPKFTLNNVSSAWSASNLNTEVYTGGGTEKGAISVEEGDNNEDDDRPI